jgi:CRP/FNR family transcriptional regulator
MNDPAAARTLVLERFPALAGLPEATLDALLRSPVRRIPAGSVLFQANQPCAGFPLVLEGSVRVTKTAPNGREIMLYRVDPGESCILSGSCLVGHAPYSASGIVESDVTVLLIPAALFHELMVGHATFREYVFGLYATRLAEVMELIEEVAFRRLDTRLAQLLVHRGPVLEATHQKLADELGSVREIVSRLLRSFEDRGWVKLERERVTVRDPQALATLARS